MKKYFLLSLASIVAVSSFAQKQTSQIVLTNKQILKFSTTVKGNMSQESVMGNVDMTIDMLADKNIVVKDISKEKYNLDYTATHIKMSFDMPGKSMKFDSDKKEDANGDLKDFAKDINVPKRFELSFDNNCASLDTAKTGATDNSDMMTGMIMQMIGSGNDDAVIESYFMLLPVNAKLGSTWSDSSISEGLKKYNTYKWDSTVKNIATISVTQKIINNSKTEMMGMDIKSDITNDITEARKVDIASAVVISRKSTSKLSGTAEVLGMSMPISGTIVTEVTSE